MYDIVYYLNRDIWLRLFDYVNTVPEYTSDNAYDSWRTIISNRFNCKYEECPDDSYWGILLFKSEKDLVWFLLQI